MDRHEDTRLEENFSQKPKKHNQSKKFFFNNEIQLSKLFLLWDDKEFQHLSCLINFTAWQNWLSTYSIYWQGRNKGYNLDWKSLDMCSCPSIHTEVILMVIGGRSTGELVSKFLSFYSFYNMLDLLQILKILYPDRKIFFLKYFLSPSAQGHTGNSGSSR